MPERFKVLVAAAVIFLMGQFLYLNTLQHGFVWDDHLLINDNPQMQTIHSVKDFFTKDMWENSTTPYKSGFYRPITLTSFLFDALQWGGNPFGFHLANSLIHAFNGVLLFLILYTLLQNRKTSFIAGIIFIIHPIQTESVAFISDRGDLLCVFFILIHILFYIAYRQTDKIYHMVLSMVGLAFAFLSKENAMIGFVLTAGVEWFFFAKMRVREFVRKSGLIIVLMVLTGAYVYWRSILLGGVNAVTTLGEVRYVSILPGFDSYTHLLLVVKIIAHYLIAVILPYNQSISYVILPETSIWEPMMLIKTVFLLVQLFLFFAFVKEKRYMLLFGMIWFYVTLLPLVNLIPISNTVADRFLYLPMVGASLFMAESIVLLYGHMKSQKTRNFYAALMVVLAILLSLKTVMRNQDWHNDYTLFTSALNEQPCAPMAELNLSTYYTIYNDPVRSAQHRQNYQRCIQQTQKDYRAMKEAYLSQ